MLLQLWCLWVVLLDSGWYHNFAVYPSENKMVKTDYLNQQCHQPAWLFKTETLVSYVTKISQIFSSVFQLHWMLGSRSRRSSEMPFSLWVSVVMGHEQAVLFNVSQCNIDKLIIATLSKTLQLSHWWEAFLPFTRQTKHWWKRIIWVTSCNVSHPRIELIVMCRHAKPAEFVRGLKLHILLQLSR